MTNGPSWYDILGVDRSASPEQIKAAWREATDKFEPGSGQSQFMLFNEAANVLLDPVRRREYDEQMEDRTAAPDAPAGPAESAAEVDLGESRPRPERPDRPEPVGAAEVQHEPTDAGPPSDRQTTLVRTLAALTTLAVVVALVFAVLIWQRASKVDAGFLEGVTQGDSEARVDAATSASAAAERALAAALSYDYRRMEADRQRALGFMTERYGKKFADTFDKLLTAAEEGKPNNVVKTKTVVKAVVRQVGVMNPSASSTERVRLLAYVNQTAVKGTETPTIFENRVAVTMVERDGQWLIDGLTSY